uniref:Uncharacterized protein n=1 Tax=Knipowitschia caucasica TaxID=637954 RepID=A0AAV2M0X9_KNICA
MLSFPGQFTLTSARLQRSVQRQDIPQKVRSAGRANIRGSPLHPPSQAERFTVSAQEAVEHPEQHPEQRLPSSEWPGSVMWPTGGSKACLEVRSPLQARYPLVVARV